MKRSLTLLALYSGQAMFLIAGLWLLLFLWSIPGVFPTTVNETSLFLGLTNFLAILFNLLLVLVFGLQHSVMARKSFKQWLTRWLDYRLERVLYFHASNVVMVLLLLLWQPVSGVIYSLQNELAVWILRLVSVLGLVIAGLGVISIDSSELSGTRQVSAFLKGQDWRGLSFQEPGIYRWVRHPMQLGILIFLWATPLLSISHALFAVSMTVYILVGLVFEERSLAAEFGEDYRRYQARVPMLFPRFKRSNNN